MFNLFPSKLHMVLGALSLSLVLYWIWEEAAPRKFLTRARKNGALAPHKSHTLPTQRHRHRLRHHHRRRHRHVVVAMPAPPSAASLLRPKLTARAQGAPLASPRRGAAAAGQTSASH